MATTENNYTGSTATTYSFTFPYLKSTDVKVSKNGTVLALGSGSTEYTQATTSITLGAAPLATDKIRIYRETGDSNLTATFYPGSAIKSSDLNDNFTQNLYSTQEVVSRYLDTGGLGTMTGDLKLGKDADIIFEGNTEDGNDVKLTVADGLSGGVKTITFPDETGTVVTSASTNVIDSDHYVDGSIDNVHLADDAVDSDEIASGAIDLAHMSANSVDSDQYVDGSIDRVHLAADIIDGTKIADDAIDSEHYAAGSIDLEHMSANSVDSDQYVDGSIDGVHIANDQIDSQHYAAGSIDLEHMSANSVDSDQYVDGSIDLAHMSANSVDSDQYVDGSIDRVHLAADIVDGTKIADDSIDSEHYVDGSIDTAHIADLNVTTGKLANDAVNAAKIGDDVVNSEHYAAASIDTEHIADLNITTGLIANLNVTTGKIADNAVTMAKVGCEQTTITDSDSHVPTSGAVVDYVAGQLAPIGGFTAIANEDKFPTTQPVVGVIISISDAAGVVVTSDGTLKSTTARRDGAGSDNVVITDFPSSLSGETLASGVGLMVSSDPASNAGGNHYYKYHKLLAAEGDVKQLSDDINDFNARYRVNAGEPSSANDEGDLCFDTSANKMKVYDGSAWGEVTSSGDYKYLFLCPAGGTGAPTINGSIATYDLRESSNSGSAASVNSAAQLLVSVNGVIQKPNTGTSAPSEGFALVDSNTIIFGANLPTGAEVFVTQVGTATTLNIPADTSVTTAKIASAAVETAKIADLNVTTAKLAVDAVTGAKIADDAIDSEHYTDGSIDTAHIADDAVTSAKLDTNIDLAGTLDVTSNAVFDANLTQSAPSTTAGGALLSEGTIYLRPKDSRGDSAAGLVIYNDTFSGSGTASITAAGAATFAAGNFDLADYGALSIKRTDGNNYPLIRWGTDTNYSGGGIYPDGSATFAGEVDFNKSSASSSTKLLQGNSDVGQNAGTLVEKFNITADGSATFAGTVTDSKGNVRSIPQNTQGSTYTLVAADAGKHILASGTVTVPNSVFSAGDAVTIVNNTASNLTITKTITTMYMSSDATSTNRTLAARGMATILFASGTVAYISGAGLS